MLSAIADLIPIGIVGALALFVVLWDSYYRNPTHPSEREHEDQQANSRQEEALDASIRDAEKQQRSRYRKVKEYFSVARNLVSLGTLCFVAAYTVIAYYQITTTRESFTIVQRAFVTVSRLEVTPFRDANGGGVISWVFFPLVKNSGATPTQNLEYVWGFAGFGNPNFVNVIAAVSDPRSDPESTFKSGYKVTGVAGPQDTLDISRPGQGIPTSAFESTESGAVFQAYTGVIHYNNIFPGSAGHRTKYCFMIRVNRNQSGSVVPDAIRCPHWNCADEECTKEEREIKPTSQNP